MSFPMLIPAKGDELDSRLVLRMTEHELQENESVAFDDQLSPYQPLMCAVDLECSLRVFNHLILT